MARRRDEMSWLNCLQQSKADRAVVDGRAVGRGWLAGWMAVVVDVDFNSVIIAQ